eukprot:3607155-Prymnesium_polylepis.1
MVFFLSYHGNHPTPRIVGGWGCVIIKQCEIGNGVIRRERCARWFGSIHGGVTSSSTCGRVRDVLRGQRERRTDKR